MSRKVLRRLVCAAAAGAAIANAHFVWAVDASYVGPGSGSWNVAANWSGGAVPNNNVPLGTRYDVFIDGGDVQSSQVIVPAGASFTVDDLAVDVGDQLELGNNSTFTLVGDGTTATLNNAGLIRVLSTGSTTDLRFEALANTLTGGGIIHLGGGAARLYSSAGRRITVADQVIEGAGSIGVNAAPFTNQATIRANAAGLTLGIDPPNVADAFLNSGTLLATNGGILLLTGNGAGAFTNTGGVIRADAGSEVRFTLSASITGGLLTTTADGVLRNNPSQILSLTDVTNSGNFVAENNSSTDLSGTIANSGSMNINATVNATDLRLLGGATVTLTGGGAINLTGTATTSFARIASAGLGTNTLHNLDNTIRGEGSLGTNSIAIVNDGVVRADVSARTLALDPGNFGTAAFVNNGTIQASNGGVILLTGNGGGSFTNNNVVQALDASEVQLSNFATVRGGTISTTGTGVVRALASQNVFLYDITNAGRMVSDNNSDFGVGGTIDNRGWISIESTINGTDVELQTDTTLTGGGTVTLVNLSSTANDFSRINGTGRLTNADNVIEGFGVIGANSIPVTNGAAGAIHANVDGAVLTVDPGNFGATAFVNDGVLRASGGGILRLTGNGGGEFDNNNLIEALDGSEAQLTVVARVTGGTFATAGTGVIRALASQNVYFTDVTNTGRMIGDNNGDFGIAGAIHNVGSITIESTTNATDVELQTDTTLTGGGTVTLVNLSNPANDFSGINGVGRLTNANNVIQGQGRIGQNAITLTNGPAGLIHANVAGGTLTIDPANLGADAFVNQGTLRVSGGGVLVLSGNGGGGFNSVSGAIQVASDGTLTTSVAAVVNAGSIALDGAWNTVSGTIATGPVTGPGTLNHGGGVTTVQRFNLPTVNLSAGTLAVAAGGGTANTSRAENLAISGASRLDLTDHDFILDYSGASPAETVRGHLRTGYNNGAWNGNGIMSSSAAANPGFGVGLAEATHLFTSFPATFSGQQVDDTTLLLRYTRHGDANLDGLVNLSDFNRLANNFGTLGKIWSQGDFNHDGTVNLSDFNLLANNFGLSALGPDVTPQDWATLAAAVPEPAAAGVLVAAGMLVRRRRS